MQTFSYPLGFVMNWMLFDKETSVLQSMAFRNYWERGPALLGGKLVYNTGRHLGKYEALFREKWACMARPDALICSVGTEVQPWHQSSAVTSILQNLSYTSVSLQRTDHQIDCSARSVCVALQLVVHTL